MRHPLAPPAAILLLGAALRLWDLDRTGLWHDEAYTAALLRLPFAGIVEALRRDAAPPLLYFLLKLVPHTAAGETWLRLPGALASVATLPVVFLLGRALGGARAGSWAMLLTAVAPLQVHYAREARSYPFLGLAAAGAALAVVRYRQEGGTRFLWLYAVSMSAMIYLHNVGWFFLAAGALVLLAGCRTAAQRAAVAVAHGGTVLVFAPWLPVFLEQLRASSRLVDWMQAFWRSYPPPLALYRTLEAHSFFPKAPAFVGLEWMPALAPVWIVSSLTAAAYGWSRAGRRRRDMLAVGALAGAPWIALYLYSFRQPVFLAGRTDAFLFPLFAALVAPGLTRLAERAPWVTAAAGAAVLASTLLVNARVVLAPGERDRETASWISTVAGPDDVVILSGPKTVTMDYYVRRDCAARRAYFPASLGKVFSTRPYDHTQEEEARLGREARALEQSARGAGTAWIVGVERSLTPTLIRLFLEQGWRPDSRRRSFRLFKLNLAGSVVGLRPPPPDDALTFPTDDS